VNICPKRDENMSRHPHLWLYIGLLVLLLGIQLHAVDTYVLSPTATRILADWFGRPSDTPQGAIEQLALKSDALAHYNLSPPSWLAWAMLSAGAVMVTHGVILKRTGH